MSGYSAVIIASGQASRLGSICAHTPKCMLLFDGIPFLRYLISWLLYHGAEDVVITGSTSCNGGAIAREIANQVGYDGRQRGEGVERFHPPRIARSIKPGGFP